MSSLLQSGWFYVAVTGAAAGLALYGEGKIAVILVIVEGLIYFVGDHVAPIFDDTLRGDD